MMLKLSHNLKYGARMNFIDDIPVVKEEVELEQIWFCGGRIGASLSRHGGLTNIVYYGKQNLDSAKLFSADPVSVWTKLFRLYVVIDNKMYYPEFNRTFIYPFGYSSEFNLENVFFRHELILLNDTLVQKVKIIKNPGNHKISLKMLFHESITKILKANRQWGDFNPKAQLNCLMAKVIDSIPREEYRKSEEKGNYTLTQKPAFGFTDSLPGEIFVAISSEKRLEFLRRREGFKDYIQTDDFKDEASIFVIFGFEEEKFLERLERLKKNVLVESNEKIESFYARLKSQPRINIKNKSTQSCLSNIPSITGSLKVQDIKGGMRAAASHYWIWGWDSMVYPEAILLWTDSVFVKDMLKFYKDLADDKLGIPHSISTELKPLMAMAFPAQCLYIVMLYNYYVFTKDISILKEYYPFAKWIFKRTLEKEVKATGLIEGVSLYPDWPEYLGQDGQDISVFNNSIFYQALRVMEYLSSETDDLDTSIKAREIAKRCRGNFIKYLFDKEKGYFVDSVSSRDFEKRFHYPIYAILWVTPFAYELVNHNIHRIAEFMEKNFKQKRGLSMFPRWDGCFMADGNQLGTYMPTTEPFYRNIMKFTDKRGELTSWFDLVSWYWNKNTIPEGLACEAENEGITADKPGGKQPFCAKAWYSLFFTAIAGFEIDPAGITVSTPDGDTLSIENIKIGNKKIDFKVSGRGKYIDSITINGKALTGSHKIGFSMLKEKNLIEVKKSNRIYVGVRILKADGIDVKIEKEEGKKIAGFFTGKISGEVSFFSPQNPQVKLDGKAIEPNYNTSTNVGTCFIDEFKNNKVNFEIRY